MQNYKKSISKEDQNFYGFDNLHNFTGYTYDETLDLYFAQNRFYDPTTYRFTQQDPVKDGTNWYVYVDSNPLMYVDMLGLKPSVMEAALMAKHIYLFDTLENFGFGADKQLRIIYDSEGNATQWRLIDGYKEGTSVVGIYIKSSDISHTSNNDWRDPLEYAIVSKGTNPVEIEDWTNNIAQATNWWESEHMTYYLDFVCEFKSQYIHKEITFIGHSKGGGEAITAARIHNMPAIVFNTSVPDNVPEADQNVYNFWSWANKIKHPEIESYIVTGEILNAMIGDPKLGTITQIPAENSLEVMNAYIDFYFNSDYLEAIQNMDLSKIDTDVIGIALDLHSMDSVIASLEKEGY